MDKKVSQHASFIIPSLVIRAAAFIGSNISLLGFILLGPIGVVLNILTKLILLSLSII